MTQDLRETSEARGRSVAPDPGATREPPAARIRVAVIDDHLMFADALAMALDAEPDLECVGTAPSVAEALQLIERTRPSTVLMDVYLPLTDGIAGMRTILERWPETQVFILTGRPDVHTLADAADAGATAFIAKEQSLDEIVAAIHDPEMAAQTITHASVVADITATIRDRQTTGPQHQPALTPRERDVLALLAEGAAPDTIARVLGISVHTCRGHVKNLLLKFGVHSQLQIVVAAARSGLLPDPTEAHPRPR